MRQLLFLSLLGVLTSLTVSCGTSSSESSSTEPEPTPPAVATPAPEVPNPVEAAKEDAKVATTSKTTTGLLPSTNPDARRQTIPAGKRTDPFSGISVSPEITLPKPTPSPQSPNSTSSSSGASGASSPQPPASGAIPSGTTGASRPGGIPKAPPAAPSTDLAKAVEVTGVVQLGSMIQAIVKAPNEPSSRNVQAGERLSNGQVLIKRIDVGAGGNPIVVLEQNGVEVIKNLADEATGVTG
jgi:hypothetical protein